MAYLTKSNTQILQECLQKISRIGISNISPGSFARAIAEIITTELGDFYAILDFNSNQNLVQSATGTSLDALGVLYNVQRQTVTQSEAIAANLGVFYFYIDQPWTQAVFIPSGTNVYTDVDTFVGKQFSYQTVTDSYILPGHTKVWASIRPNFQAGYYSAGPNTLTVMDPLFQQPAGITVKCTNPKAIPIQTTSESDTSYRARIIQSVNTTSGGTVGAMRFVALTVPGVRDVIMRDIPYGLGTVEALVVTNDNLPNNLGVVNNVTSVLVNNKPAGIRVYVRQPVLLPVDVGVTIIPNPNASNVNVSNAMQLTANAITNFLNAPTVGSPLVYYELIQTILSATDYTSDVVVNDLAVNGVQILRQNYTPASDQQIIPGNIVVNVATSV